MTVHSLTQSLEIRFSSVMFNPFLLDGEKYLRYKEPAWLLMRKVPDTISKIQPKNIESVAPTDEEMITKTRCVETLFDYRKTSMTRLWK